MELVIGYLALMCCTFLCLGLMFAWWLVRRGWERADKMESSAQKTEATGITVYCDLCDTPMRCEKVSEHRWEQLRCENQRCRAVRHVYRKGAAREGG